MEGIITLIIIIISVIGWVANAMQEQNAKQQKQQKGNGQQQRPPRRLQDEIESFLKEIQDQQQVPQEQQRQDDGARKDSFEDPPQRPQSRPSPSQPAMSKRQQRKQQREAQNRSKTQGRSAPSKLTIPANSPIAQDSVSDATRTTGQSPEQTLGETLGLGKQADAELQSLLSAEQMLALKKLAEERSSRHHVTAGSLSQMLSSRESIRAAFIVNEILSPPLSMRESKSS